MGTGVGGDGLGTLVEQLVAEGQRRPEWLGVEDEAGRGLLRAAGLTPERRAGSVLVVRTESGAVAAARLGIGGALWWPPARVSLTRALAAAAEAAALSEVEAIEARVSRADAEALLDGAGGRLVRLEPVRRRFWLEQLGAGELERRMAEAASKFDVPHVVVEGAALIVPVGRALDLCTEWFDLTGVPAPWRTEGVAPAGAQEVVQGGEPDIVRPVYSIPEGRRIGSWRPAALEDGWRGTGTVLYPSGEGAAGASWRIEGPERRTAEIPQVVEVAQVETARGVAAVRLPGWLGCGLRAGTPAWALVERLARAAGKRGVPLWIPNVDDEALRLILGLGIEIWTDGPAVPLS